MRRFALILSLVLSMLTLPAGAGVLDVEALDIEPKDPTGLIASDNVELLTTLPNPGVIGARFRDGIMYTTAVTGVFIYDVEADPANPALIGQLPMPHFENEDVDLGGDILLVSNDAAESTGILHIIDISDPTAPALLNSYQMGGNPLLGGPGHTASCLLDCAFAIVSDSGGFRVLDLADPTAPINMGTFASPAAGSLGVTHDVQVDGDGMVWLVGYGGTAGYTIPDTVEGYRAMLTGEDGGPARLGDLITDNSEVADSQYATHFGTGETEYNDFIHHNSMRVAGSDLVYVTEEDYTRPGCRGAGEFQIWQAPTEEVEVAPGEFETRIVPGSQMDEVGDWTVELLQDVAQPAAHCSAHYFDIRESDGLVAQGWYQQGTRILDVRDPANITQVAFFAPQFALTWAAYWSPIEGAEDILYVLDASHGIDVLRIEAEAGDPDLTAPIRESWRTGVGGNPLAADPRYGMACALLNPAALRVE